MKTEKKKVISLCEDFSSLLQALLWHPLSCHVPLCMNWAQLVETLRRATVHLTHQLCAMHQLFLMHFNTLFAIAIELYCSCMSLYDRHFSDVYNAPVQLDFLSLAQQSHPCTHHWRYLAIGSVIKVTPEVTLTTSDLKTKTSWRI